MVCGIVIAQEVPNLPRLRTKFEALYAKKFEALRAKKHHEPPLAATLGASSAQQRSYFAASVGAGVAPGAVGPYR